MNPAVLRHRCGRTDAVESLAIQRGYTFVFREWQGRKDSNLGPSVLETDALTRLSYAPIRSDSTQHPMSHPDADSIEA